MNTMTLNVREMRKHSRESLQTVKENWQILLLLLLFMCGLICGSLMLKNNTHHSQALIEILLKRLTSSQWTVRLTPLLFEAVIGLLLSFFAGFNAIGLPVILCLPCVKGIGYGALAARLYTVYRVKGVVFSLLVLYPFLAAEIALLLVCLSDSMQMSSALFSVIRGSSEAGERGAVKRYSVHYLTTAFISALIILLQSLLSGTVGSALLN